MVARKSAAVIALLPTCATASPPGLFLSARHLAQAEPVVPAATTTADSREPRPGDAIDYHLARTYPRLRPEGSVTWTVVEVVNLCVGSLNVASGVGERMT